MEQSVENIKWATKRLSVFREFPGFPQSMENLEERAKSFLRLVRNEKIEHSKLGSVNDVDWLLTKIYEGWERFPLPVEMRMIYSEYFKPADEQ